MSKNFNFIDVLGYGWRVMKRNLWFFVGVGFVFVVITYIPTVVHLILQILNLPELLYIVLYIAVMILGWVINIVLGIGLVKIALKFCDGQKPEFSTLFNAWDCFWRYLGAGILYVLIMYGGFILLIIPGIIWSIQFGLFSYFVVDKGLGPINALKASSRTTRGMKWELLGFWVLCGMISFAGFLCFVVGIFAAYPTVIVAHALVYRQLFAQTPEVNELLIVREQGEDEDGIKPVSLEQGWE